MVILAHMYIGAMMAIHHFGIGFIYKYDVYLYVYLAE